MAVVCHCRNCQRQAGSAFSTIVGTSEDDFKFTAGTPKEYVDTDTDSGNTVRRFFCGDCGSPIYSALDAQPGAIYVKSGTLDETSSFKPQAHVWCSSKQNWVEIDSAVPQMAKQS
jgi:hypothetical protein